VAERVCIAQIGAPHGVRGEVRLWTFTEDPMAVAGYGPLESEDGSRRFILQAVRPAKGHLVARLHGVDDRSAAERLRNAKLYVARDRLPPTDAETFYHADLIGLTAVDQDGAAFGTVLALHNFGAGDLLEIRRAEGGATVLLPFTKVAVPTVDVAGGRVVVNPPEETLGENGPSAPAED
jgi:16S rRNA processing protein RimM